LDVVVLLVLEGSPQGTQTPTRLFAETETKVDSVFWLEIVLSKLSRYDETLATQLVR
jgi:hypothetical protein